MNSKYNNFDKTDFIATIKELERELKNIKVSIKTARNIAYDAPELNMSNFDTEQAYKLNEDMCELFGILDDLDT